MSKGAYESNLRHIAEPQSPSERENATSVTIEDHLALWFGDVLREYAHYEADEPHDGIAVGLASYIDKKVRDQGKSQVSLYAHTLKAVETIENAANYGVSEVDTRSVGGLIVEAAGDLRYEYAGMNEELDQ